MRTHRDDIRAHDALNEAFATGRVFSEGGDALRAHLVTLSTVEAGSQGLQYREVIRALTINHVQMAHLIERVEVTMTQLNASNAMVQRRMERLTRLGVALAIIQVAIAILLWLRA